MAELFGFTRLLPADLRDIGSASVLVLAFVTVSVSRLFSRLIIYTT
jgi:hypothetical protein